MKKFDDFWKWYDNIKEPYKLLFLIIVLMSPMWISFLIGNNILFCLYVPIIMSRMLYKYKDGTE